MSILILDYDYLKSKNLFPEYQPFDKNDNFLKTGLIFIIPNYIHKQMTYLPFEERLNFLKSNNFKESILEHIQFNINQIKKKIYFSLHKNFIQYINKILSSLYQNFPHNYKIVLKSSFPLNNKYLPIIIKYFSFPVYDNKTQKIFFFRDNNNDKFINKEQSLHLYNKIKQDILKLKKDEIINCEVYIHFTQKTIDELRKINLKVFEHKNTFEGLEQSDKFIINNIKPYKDSSLITLEMCKKDLKIGDNDSVDVVFSKYTFHTHPNKTYDKFEVKYAWPSSNDFESFISLFLDNITIFHVTCTLEGAYFTTVNSAFMEFLYNFSDDDYSYICQNFYNICYPSYDIDRQKLNHKCPNSPENFLKLVNNQKIKFHNKEYPPIFNVKFLSWDEFSNKKIFKIPYYSDENMSCAISDVPKNLS